MKTEYRTRVLDALSLFVGKDGIEANKTKLAELTTTDSVDGTQFIENYIKANFDSTDGVSLTDNARLYTGYRGVPRNVNDSQLASLNEQRNSIGTVIDKGDRASNDEKKAAASAWIEMYSVGIGARNPGVIPNGQVSGSGNGSVHKNLPAFAVRWLIKEVSDFDNSPQGIKDLLNKVAGVNIDGLSEPLKGQVEGLIGRIDQLDDEVAKNLFAGILASSITNINSASNRKVQVSIDVKNMLDRLIAHFASQLPARETVINQLMDNLNGVTDGNKTVELGLNKTQWDQSASADSATSMIIMDELFNTKNNPNNPSGKQPAILQNIVADVDENSTVPIVNNPIYQSVDTSNLSGVTLDDSAISSLDTSSNNFPEVNNLDEDKATQLIGTWLNAKNIVFDLSSASRVDLVNRFTMGDYRDRLLNAAKNGISFNQKIEYENQNVVSVSDFKEDGDNFTVIAQIYEDREYNGDPNNRNSGQFLQTVKYTFSKDSGYWKISDYEPQSQ